MIKAIVNFFKRKKTNLEILVMRKDHHTYRFEKWEDAIPYIGKPVVVCRVESPNTTGYLTGISVSMLGDKITTGFLEVNHYRYEYWRCRPDFYAIENPRSFRVFG